MRRLASTLLSGMLLVACARNPGPGGAVPDLLGPVGRGTAPETVDSLYARAEQLFRQGRWRRAQELFTRVVPGLVTEDPRYARARFYLGETHYALREYLLASRELRRLSDEQPGDPLAPEALFRAGMAYRELWRRPQLDPTHGETAMLVFAEVAGRYPGSRAADRAQQMMLELQEWFADKEFRNARYYLRYKAYESAILVLREIVASYPRTTVAPRAVVAMIGAYVALGYEEDRQETCDYLRQYYPAAVGSTRHCPTPTPPGG